MYVQLKMYIHHSNRNELNSVKQINMCGTANSFFYSFHKIRSQDFINVLRNKK